MPLARQAFGAVTMAGLMQWFQVTCPSCTVALQVRLPEGVTSVQCSQCKAVFAVQVQPIALSAASMPAPKRSRKRKSGGDKSGAQGEPNRMLSAYNVFMKGEVAKVKAEHPELVHRDAFKLAAERWQTSPMNPQNGGERFPLKAASLSMAAPPSAMDGHFDSGLTGADEEGATCEEDEDGLDEGDGGADEEEGGDED